MLIRVKDRMKTIIIVIDTSKVNLLIAKCFSLNFYSLEVVSRWRDPQLQVSENYIDFSIWRPRIFDFYCE